MPSLHSSIAALLLAVATVAAIPSGAQTPASQATEVAALLNEGKLDAALARADALLAANPRDAQLRFLRGVILTEQKKTVEARTVFEALTQEFPELPEPYNNLAVLLAAEGRLQQALALLEQAVRAAPNYVTAQENIGDIYLSLAEESYLKALALDARRASAQTKLAITRELIGRIRAVR